MKTDSKASLELGEVGGVQSSSKEAEELWRDIKMQDDIMAAAQAGSQPVGGAKKRKG